jgi:hypothetical protein
MSLLFCWNVVPITHAYVEIKSADFSTIFTPHRTILTVAINPRSNLWIILHVSGRRQFCYIKYLNHRLLRISSSRHVLKKILFVCVVR